MARPVEYMRADAARNVHRIVAVAARLLGENPGAGMADVAAAAGVSRATVYRHFPTREALITAIHAQAFELAQQTLADAELDKGSATDALRRLTPAWLALVERYAFVERPEPDPERKRVLGEPLLALFARGDFKTPPAWAARAFGALLLAGARCVNEGTLSHDEAADLVFRTLMEGL
jgi:TetR/AcrR family transcriptional repressor of mexCD-oprJ operon